MPEMQFSVRWPDGTESLCYSPSLVIEDHLAPGTSYTLDDFIGRSRTALSIASDRVQQKYGFPCSRALGQLAELDRRVAHFSGNDRASPDSRVTVLAFHRDDAPRAGTRT
ncbi:MAG: MSMEG_0570 family nitrogen starvation response protein [Janthinobacterium lividum]